MPTGTFWMNPSPNDLVDLSQRMNSTETVAFALECAPDDRVARVFRYKGMDQVP